MTNVFGRHQSGIALAVILSRRGFIGGTAALGLAGALFAKPSVAAPAATLIDTITTSFHRPLSRRHGSNGKTHAEFRIFPLRWPGPKCKAIEEMDEAGIRTAVLSIASTPGVWFDLDAERASQMARDCNDYVRQMDARETRPPWPVATLL